ncbi:dockerin type I repeat-containing protein [uncultured Ruminococcus sp.]|uniref:dockerin type I repeat-containing protein n=2 Tax=Ruminococcus TaxID=1263 RepID=UPI0025CBFDB4|nr:dockerin type I repeat-containing protein [uncultured Ruminococcus sp.]
MKGKKMLSLLSAGTIACAMLAALPVSAAGTAVTGDIDQDGVITGHDTAMISRYLADDAYTLTEEQLKLADINGDGTVDQTDADLLHAKEVYPLGYSESYTDYFTKEEMKVVTLTSIDWGLSYYAYQCAGVTPENMEQVLSLTPVQLNLLDVDADGTITIADAYYMLCAYSYYFAGGGTPYVEGRYDFVVKEHNGKMDYDYGWGNVTYYGENGGTGLSAFTEDVQQ